MFAEEARIVVDAATGAHEALGWLQVDGARLHGVRHRCGAAPRWRVVVLGPIGAERERSYRTLVELARTLARRGNDVLRHDPRGMGESEGEFERCTVETWTRDAERVVERVHGEPGSAPVALLGVRIGALIAGEILARGLADAAILVGGGDGATLLRDAARRALAADLVKNSTGGPRAATQPRPVLSELAAGRDAMVDGYRWTPALLADAATRRFNDAGSHDRPWVSIDCVPRPTPSAAMEAQDELSRRRVRVATPRFWESSPRLVPSDDSLACTIAEWLEGVAVAAAERSPLVPQEACDDDAASAAISSEECPSPGVAFDDGMFDRSGAVAHRRVEASGLVSAIEGNARR